MAEKSSVPAAKVVSAHHCVFQATVGRVLNSNYKHGFSVSKEIRRRITRVADTLGYRPNLASKNLK